MLFIHCQSIAHLAKQMIGKPISLDKVEEDIQRFTFTAEPQVEYKAEADTALITIRHHLNNKQEMVDMSRMWIYDQPIRGSQRSQIMCHRLHHEC
ncbi:hypothetical protein niasHS_000226 [Heterodera schachtii]|uniref:Uncharacterized protein n=1 Tax=Heterodera schachtii TaxID=97005 RepID=A0ABD2KBF2_HETSC